MNIAILGYGRMGKAIEQVALKRNHKIILKIEDDIAKHDLSKVDVAIDFSIPTAAFKNITHCFEKNVAAVSGTTGWLDKYEQAIESCTKNGGAFIYASNFSLGVNVFFNLNSYLAKIMKNLQEYDVSMEEIHHTQKLDKPSGTAITLAQGIINNSDKTTWALQGNKGDQVIPIEAKRIPNVPGTHKIKYNSEVDKIEIEHVAHNREGFALGAVIAAEYLLGKKGVHSMNDVLGL
jgi:4-hydroxy-tetrahydrodipicolinate reductase